MAEANVSADLTELVDVDELRRHVQEKYKDLAETPEGEFHFRTGREHALAIGYAAAELDRLPDEAIEAFAGVGNPFHWGTPRPEETVVDLGSGAGMDSFLAGFSVGPQGRVIGVDMTYEMVERARKVATEIGLENVEFRAGVIEDLPLSSSSVDVVISNGVINLCPDKHRVYKEIHRVLKPGGRMTIADICLERPVSEEALKDIDLWTG